MKKTIIALCALAILAIGLAVSLARNEKNRIVHVVSNGGSIPDYPPSEGYAFLGKCLENKGYKAEWFDVKSVPKKREYGARLYNYFKTKKGPYIFNNYYDYFSKAKIAHLPKGKRILIAWEPPSVISEMYNEKVFDAFDRVYTWNDDMVDGKKFFKFCYSELRPMQKSLPSFEERRLVCMINSNLKFNNYKNELYSLRREMAEFFDSQPEALFDLYGRNWGGFRSARGRAPSKDETLQQYKFCICFENTKDPGYITEKIFDCFAVGTIPIYLGAPNIEAYIPKECFIDYRQFKSKEEMLSFIQNLSEEEYENYLNHIRSYIESDAAKQFTREALSKIMMDAIES